MQAILVSVQLRDMCIRYHHSTTKKINILIVEWLSKYVYVNNNKH